MTQDEKDRLKEEAMRLYRDTYSERGARLETFEAYYVSKGIEAMAAVCFRAMESRGS